MNFTSFVANFKLPGRGGNRCKVHFHYLCNSENQFANFHFICLRRTEYLEFSELQRKIVSADKKFLPLNNQIALN